ncbi:SGNH/GDSL hydrolase family protein [Archangium violaceum]|uniref:hypothetical protein n=1 Tax=Archangium violaceum TaxID=83451 RepID=UPI002B313991|nr:SGNH/GDSL hydrolase family protein [Archangium violaceum]
MSTSREMTPKKGLLLSLAVFAALFVVGERALARYGWGHFHPPKKLTAAREGGKDCVVFTGDSRMEAGYSGPQLREGLTSGGLDTCVGDLSLGGAGMDAQFTMVREYLASGSPPRAVVVGVVAEALMDEKAADSSQWVGNLAANLLFSRFADAPLHFPFVTAEAIQVLDRRLRFQLERLSSYGIYRSIIWSKVQAVQDRLVKRAPVARNEFGALEDMKNLGESFTARGQQSLATWKATHTFQPNRYFVALMEETSRQGVPLILVELPMPEAYLRELTRSPEGTALRQEMKRILAGRGIHYIDLASPSWFSDRLLSDGVHLNREGAALLSKDMGRELSHVLVRQPDAAPRMGEAGAP